MFFTFLNASHCVDVVLYADINGGHQHETLPLRTADIPKASQFVSVG
jgi:hypothetical protein